MTDLPPEEQSTGEYVYDSPYRLMRVRMLLTGEASPTEEVWTDALAQLLDFLEYTEAGRGLVGDMLQRRLAK